MVERRRLNQAKKKSEVDVNRLTAAERNALRNPYQSSASYYDWVARKWVPRQIVPETSWQRRRRVKRDKLIYLVMDEFKFGKDPLTRLYAALLAQALCQTCEDLMKQYGQSVMEETSPDREKVD
jgi:hypothetical protein